MITVIDYGAGNLFSVEKAFSAIGAEVCVSERAEDLTSADKIILPGVGAFGDCMTRLNASGLVPLLKERIAEGVPLLGICVGLQILFEGSEESPDVQGLGLLRGYVKKISAKNEKIPHMGWNAVSIEENDRGSGLLKNIPDASYVYFVHSYHAVPSEPSMISSTCFYGEKITASIASNHIMATQFHPEKSGKIGLAMIRNFANC